MGEHLSLCPFVLHLIIGVDMYAIVLVCEQHARYYIEAGQRVWRWLQVDIFSLGVIMYETFLMQTMQDKVSKSSEAIEYEVYAKLVAMGTRQELKPSWPESLKVCLILRSSANRLCMQSSCRHWWCAWSALHYQSSQNVWSVSLDSCLLKLVVYSS
jgi:hypothetical protein